MNAHPHEVDMNMSHQHDVKMSVHTHEFKVNIVQNHEIKMPHQHENAYHELVDSKANMQLQHDVKMVAHHDMKMMNQNEVKILQNEVIHADVKMNHHEVVHHEVPLTNQHHHMMELHLQPVHQVENSEQLEQHQQQDSQKAPTPKQKVIKTEKNADNKKKKEAIDGQAREVIFKVIKFFESEKQNRGYAFPVENVVKRACAATGLSESTIKRIKRDGLRAEATQTRMQGPKKKRVRKTKVQLDYFQLCALKGIVNSYNNRKEIPTLGKILAAAKHELNYRGGKESLRLILLNKLGIKFKKLEKKNKKPPEEQQPQQAPQMQTIMPQPQMQHMKVMENQCVYGHSNMIPPVSY